MLNPPPGSGSANSLAAELAKRKANKNEKKSIAGEAMNLPEFNRYDMKTKLKLFKLNENEYFEQLFTKDNLIDPINKAQVDSENATPPTGDTTAPVQMGTIKYFGPYYYNPVALEQFFDKTIESYKSSKIFCYDEPIIKSILNPYLDVIGDFKIFYLFGNYEKAVRELKCKQQYELLETTNNFIEAITR